MATQQGWNQSVPQEILVATQLQQLVQNKEYDQLAEVLDKLAVKDDGVLGVEECKHEGMGAESSVTITFTDGRVLRHVDDEFWKAIAVTNTAAGMWQVYLLRNMWTYLPLFWHANYDKRVYIYTPAQMTIINSKPELGDNPIDIDFSRYDIAPRIEIQGDRFLVSACYWSDFEGLVREELPLGLNVIGQIVFFEPKKTVLFPYDCGICY